MNRIELVPRFSSPLPLPADRRTAFPDRRRVPDDAIVIDLNPGDYDTGSRPAAPDAVRVSDRPLPALQLAAAAREVLTYEVIARLGSEDGFGEKGQIVNGYL